MRIGIISDTHGRYETVQKTLKLLKKHRVDLILHCGDIDNVETVRLFTGFTTHFVFGNSDWDRPAMRRAMKAMGAILHDHFGNLEFDGIKLAWTHGDDKALLRDIEHSAHFDFLFYGHTHRAEQHRTGPTLVLNPGALHRACPKTFMVLNLSTWKLKTVEVKEEQ